MASAIQIRLTHILVFSIAFAIVLSIPIAIAISRGTYQQVAVDLKPQVAIFFIFDAMAKAGAVCGLLTLAVRRWHGIPFPTSAAEYLWILLGMVAVSKTIPGTYMYGIDAWIYLIAGIIAARLYRATVWEWFFSLVALRPFIMIIVVTMMSRTYYTAGLMITDLLQSVALIPCIRGSQLTGAGWAGVICHFSFLAVSTIGFLLMYFDLWQ